MIEKGTTPNGQLLAISHISIDVIHWNFFHSSPFMFLLRITQAANYGKCCKTGEWELNKAHYRSQWIDKSTAHVQGWFRSESPRLGYVYPSRASWTGSNLG